jgi:hypothetical protein
MDRNTCRGMAGLPGRLSDMTTDQDQATRYVGTFTLDSWDQHDEEPVDGFTRARAVLTKTFSGDLAGTSRTEILMASIDGTPSAYCGFEQFTGAVAGRTGSFVLRHAAGNDPVSGPWLTWQVVEGSGRGELGGVRGEGQITRQDDGTHTYWLELATG